MISGPAIGARANALTPHQLPLIYRYEYNMPSRISALHVNKLCSSGSRGLCTQARSCVSHGAARRRARCGRAYVRVDVSRSRTDRPLNWSPFEVGRARRRAHAPSTCGCAPSRYEETERLPARLRYVISDLLFKTCTGLPAPALG